MKRKLFCFLLAMIMMLAVVACGENTPPDTDEEKDAVYVLEYQAKTLKIDDEAASILASFGTPQFYQELSTCGKGDLDKLYQFGSVRIRTYQVDGCDYFSVIEIMDDLLKTKEGVTIGDTQKSVEQAYGEADEKTATAWIYHAKGMDLEFHFNESNAVKSIVYRGEN